MSMAHSLTALKMELMQNVVPQLVDRLSTAIAQEQPVHVAGMHWTMEGAQAMLDVRSVWIGNQWSGFQQQRIDRETERLYPHRSLVAGETYFAW